MDYTDENLVEVEVMCHPGLLSDEDVAKLEACAQAAGIGADQIQTLISWAEMCRLGEVSLQGVMAGWLEFSPEISDMGPRLIPATPEGEQLTRLAASVTVSFLRRRQQQKADRLLADIFQAD